MVQNNQLINQLAERFLTVGEDVKAVYEHSAKKSEGVQTRVYILTQLKILYMEISDQDFFIKCYPLHKNITYQVETQRKQSRSEENIIKAKIHLPPDASIIFRFDDDRDESGFFTTLAHEKKAANHFIMQLNNLLAEI